jgi:uncharacterized protein (TIGR02118 family)
MSSSRKTFLAGIALGTIGIAGSLSEVAAAAGGESATLLTLFLEPKDAAAFDKYYSTTHEPLVKHLPGIVSYVVSQGVITQASGQASPYHLLSMIAFESMSALTSAVESPAGVAMVADLKNFAPASSILIFSSHTA